MHVIGTAGHVDHGKSTLIEALTGVHPDRLKEEQKREMTIDLGFGWLSLDSGQEVGIVDVPGHIDFIGNLLSGIGGIDAVLFVIAADEGIMPQTIEHEAIVRLLHISKGIIVITKTDLVNDPELIRLIKEDIRLLFKGSALEHAPIVEVSANTGWGLNSLRAEISGLVANLEPKPDFGRPRLPVDRVFQLQGIGTVVTGTLQDGQFEVDNTVVVSPDENKGRIRELQIHGKKVVVAAPGNRVAINISGLSKQDIRRGDVIYLPDSYETTRRMDVYITTLPELSKPLAHNSHMQLFLGAKALDARVRVIGVQQLMPGENGFLQLEFEEPIIAARNDRLILRRFSPGETIGGGVVINAHPTGRYKRFDDEVINQLKSLLTDRPDELITSYLQGKGISSFSAICTDLQQSEEVVLAYLQAFSERNEIFVLNPDSNKAKWNVVHKCYWQKMKDALIAYLTAFHVKSPILPGANLIQIRDHLKCDESLLTGILQDLLENQEIREVEKRVYARVGHTINLTRQQASALERVTASLNGQGHKPPTIKELNSQVGQQMLSEFIQAGLLIKVSDELVYLPQQLDAYRQWLHQYFSEEGKLQLADFRDAFQTSRKYAQALLEYFDRIHFTERNGDYRTIYRK
jgi:selenocysteine-specific elongation factor